MTHWTEWAKVLGYLAVLSAVAALLIYYGAWTGGLLVALCAAQGDAERREVQCCPECGSTSIKSRSHRYTEGDETDWFCKEYDCGADFEEPETREAESSHSSPRSGVAKILADPDVTTWEEARDA